MAKLNFIVTLTKDSGTAIGSPISVSGKATRSDAEAAIAAVIAARRAQSQADTQDLVDAETAFSS